MTPKEIGVFVVAQQEKEIQKFKESEILLDGLATQIRKFFAFKRSEWITPKDLYPKIFDENQISGFIAPERKQKIIVSKWKSFLGVR